MNHRPITRTAVALFVFAALSLIVVPLIASRRYRLEQLYGEEALRVATTPASREKNRRWRQRHRDKLNDKAVALASGDPPRVVFIGDSITRNWERAGRPLWRERIAPYGALNLGFGSDRTENVLWRLGERPSGVFNAQASEIAGLRPALIVVMIGTNNTGLRNDPAEATAAGVTRIIDCLQEQCPTSRVLLHALLPRGPNATSPNRRRNDKVNRLITPLGERPGVAFVDLGHVFLDEWGTLNTSVMPDRLHPNEQGYELWSDALRPWLERSLGPLPGVAQLKQTPDRLQQKHTNSRDG